MDKLEQQKRDANHKIKMLQQQIRRGLDLATGNRDIVDLSEVPCEDDGTTLNDVRRELLLLQDQVRIEDDRFSRLIRVAKNDENDVFFTCFPNHYCTKL